MSTDSETTNRETLREHAVLALADEYGGQPDDDGEARGRYAVTTSEPASENTVGDDVRVTTWETVREACNHIADELHGCREWHDGIRDLDTGETIKVSTSVDVTPAGECDCDDNTVPGALRNWAPGGDGSLPYVERCDDCRRFANDDDAARAVAERIGGRVLWAALEGERQVRDHACPFVLTPAQLTAINPPE